MTACGIFDFVVDFLVLGPMSSGKTMLFVFFLNMVAEKRLQPLFNGFVSVSGD
jgi:hypothetical protein